MSLIDVQGKRYKGFGRCIYCDSDGGVNGLRAEHIMPFSLGGNSVIENASCTDCEKITSYLEGYLSRHIFFEYRIHANIQTRNPKERPESLSAELVIAGQNETRIFKPREHPYFLALPVWGLPGIVRGVPLQADFTHRMAHVYWYVPDALRNELSNYEQGHITRRITVNHVTVARALMKIAYCQTVAHLGLDAFDRLESHKIIRGVYHFVPHFVGCDISDPPPPSPARQMHTLEIGLFTQDQLRLWVVSLRLFSHSGTEDHGFPIYRIVVGAPKVT